MDMKYMYIHTYIHTYERTSMYMRTQNENTRKFIPVSANLFMCCRQKLCMVLKKVFKIQTRMNVCGGFPIPCLDLWESYGGQILLTKLNESSESFLEGHFQEIGARFNGLYYGARNRRTCWAWSTAFRTPQ